MIQGQGQETDSKGMPENKTRKIIEHSREVLQLVARANLP
jgi:hypothetical protein